jgi:hypothetical protein
MDRPLVVATRVENSDFTRAEARAANGIIDRLLLTEEYRLNAWRASYTCQPFLNGLISIIVTAMFCVLCQGSLYVHLSIMQSSDGEHAPQQDKRLLPKGDQRRYTAETVRRTRPKTYRKAVQLLADPTWSILQISKTLRVSEHTVRAIRQREAQSIAERKKTLAAMLANVAELGAERMEATIGKASLRDAAIGTGIAVDKMLALTG